MMVEKNTTSSSRTEEASQLRLINEENPLQLQGSDHPGMILVTNPLNGSNF